MNRKKDVLREEQKKQSVKINTGANLSIGELTKIILEKKGIKSPPMIERIKLKNGLWITPKKPFKNDTERQKWILKQKLKFGI